MDDPDTHITYHYCSNTSPSVASYAGRRVTKQEKSMGHRWVSPVVSMRPSGLLIYYNLSQGWLLEVAMRRPTNEHGHPLCVDREVV